MKRIAIVGISGSGKSVLARKLAETTDLPLIHMDQFFWKGNWEPVPEAQYLAKHAEAILGERWIIEGWINAKMADRVKLADRVIWLDYPGPRCAWNIFKRWLRHRNDARPELHDEAKEQFKWPFFWMVFNGGERKDIEDALKGVDPAKLKKVKSPREMEKVIIHV